MGRLILLNDIYQFREQKQRELEFYREKLQQLENKMFFVRKEIELTNFIIDLIEKEKILDLADVIRNNTI